MAEQIQDAAAAAGLEVAPAAGTLAADVQRQGPVPAVAPLVAAALCGLLQDLEGGRFQYFRPVGRWGYLAHQISRSQSGQGFRTILRHASPPWAEISCMQFPGVVAGAGQNWDSQKRAREIERRLARLRWVEQEQEREDSGLKGMWNRVRGRGRPSGKELYERMVKNADTMIMGMQEPDRDDDVLADVLRFTGVGPEDPGYRELVRRPATN